METQYIYGENKKPLFAIVPYEQYLELQGIKREETIPDEVAQAFLTEDKSLAQAWREYKNRTQQEVAEKLGVTQSAYAQMEKPERKLQKGTRIRLAKALGIHEKQLILG